MADQTRRSIRVIPSMTVTRRPSITDTETMTDTSDSPDAKQPGPGLWLSLIVSGFGLIAACAGMWVAYNTVLEIATVSPFELPGSETRDLGEGEYELYVRTGSAFDFDQNELTSLPSLDEVRVTNQATGELIPVERLVLLEPTIRGTNRYEALASFEVVTAGTYVVEVASDGPANRAIFGRSFETGLDDAVPWLITLLVGSLVFMLGTTLLIIGLVRRKRFRDSTVFPQRPWQPPTFPSSVRQPPAPTPRIDSGTPWDD